MSIGEVLSPREETQGLCQFLARHSTHVRPNAVSEDDSSSEYQPDNAPTLLNPKAADEENQPPREAGERTSDMQTFGTTHLGEESVGVEDSSNKGLGSSVAECPACMG